MEATKISCLCFVILELSIYFVDTLQISHTSTKVGQSSVIECTSDNGNNMAWIVNGTTVGTCSGVTANQCLPFCAVCASVIGSPAATFTYTIGSVDYTNCLKYGCQEANTGDLSEFTMEVTEFSADNSTSVLNPQEPTANTDGNVSITTPCIFPTSSDAITINWYKIFDGQADEALDSTKDSNIEIYNETQRSTCTDTCGSEEVAKMVIGCRYTPPSNPGTGFQLKAEVIHKDYNDTLYWTFDGTYYVEVPSTTSTTNMLPDTNTTHPTTSMPNGTTTSTTSKRPVTDHGLPDWAIGVIAGGAFLAIVIITIVAKKLNLCCFKKKDVEENQTGGKEQSANNIEQSEGIHMKTRV